MHPLLDRARAGEISEPPRGRVATADAGGEAGGPGAVAAEHVDCGGLHPGELWHLRSSEGMLTTGSHTTYPVRAGPQLPGSVMQFKATSLTASQCCQGEVDANCSPLPASVPQGGVSGLRMAAWEEKPELHIAAFAPLQRRLVSRPLDSA